MFCLVCSATGGRVMPDALNTVEMLQVALDSAGMGGWQLYLSTGAVHRTLRHDQIFGYSHIQPSWDLQTTVDHVISEDRASLREAFSQAKITGTIDAEARVHRGPAKEVRWIHISGRTVFKDGSPERIAGVIGDADEVKPGGVERVAHGIGERTVDDTGVLGNIGMAS